jgi:hypothetical protein
LEDLNVTAIIILKLIVKKGCVKTRFFWHRIGIHGVPFEMLNPIQDAEMLD